MTIREVFEDNKLIKDNHTYDIEELYDIVSKHADLEGLSDWRKSVRAILSENHLSQREIIHVSRGIYRFK